jgi:predicted GNAT family acetyltransferase
MSATIRRLRVDDLAALKELISEHPVRHSFVSSRLEALGSQAAAIQGFLGSFQGSRLESALMLGANVVPINTTEQSRVAFSKEIVSLRERCLSLVGRHDEVLDLWRMLEPAWGSARDVRSEQPFFSMSNPSPLQVDDQVRYSSASDLDNLFPACVAMFTEEVGISPLVNRPSAYRQRVNELVTTRRSFIRFDGDEVVFKAEVGSIGNGVAQLQGVWVHPHYRGRGIAPPAIAAVVRFVLQDLASVVSLYANVYNTRAVAAYRRVGFEQTDTFASVLL